MGWFMPTLGNRSSKQTGAVSDLQQWIQSLTASDISSQSGRVAAVSQVAERSLLMLRVPGRGCTRRNTGVHVHTSAETC